VTATREQPVDIALGPDTAHTYAGWFATLSDPTRVRLLHSVATTPTGSIRVGDLAVELGISQSTCSHHVRRLAEVGFVHVDKVGTSSVVSVNPSCCTGLPHAADVVMGSLQERPCCPEDLPTDVAVRATEDADLDVVLDIYGQGIATRNATFETEVPPAEALRRKWLPGHAWVAEVDGRVVGWTAISPVSERACYSGVGETTVYVAEDARGRGVGKALLYRQVTEADAAGLWTLQTSIFPENRASLALHHSAGYQTLAVRSRIARLDGVWRDTVLLERRSQVV
jgi:L-amino acid N-acyltransferase YncA/DNA-binding transcriptional ArsR family regulator